MKPLEGCSIAFVAEEPANVLRAEGLRLAGASVRVCLPQLDLWAILGDGAYDALVLLESEAEPSVAMVAAALEDDPRTRELPVLVLVHPSLAHRLVREASARSTVVIDTAAADDALVRAILQLTAPHRRLLEAQRQQRLLHEQFRTLLLRADESQVAMSNVAHDMRSLLGIVYGFACNLRDEIVGPLSAEQKDHVASIVEASMDAAGLLERTPGPARATDDFRRSSAPPPARGGSAQRSRVDLAALAESVVRLFEPSAQGQSKQLGCASEKVFLWGDALKLRQVLTNLIANGLKYSPPGGAVSVKVRWMAKAGAVGPSARRSAEIVVTNSGPSIAPEHRERIFERGFRLDQHAHLPGKGIGLSIVQEIVAQHGGEVRVDGEVEGETTFLVTLPCDMRFREPLFGILLAPDSDTARGLIDAIRSRDPAELRAILADTPDEFMSMASACGAAIVIPREQNLAFSDGIARLLLKAPSPPASEA